MGLEVTKDQLKGEEDKGTGGGTPRRHWPFGLEAMSQGGVFGCQV